MIEIRKVIRSFAYAWRGFVHVAREEQNFRIELVVSIIVLILAAILPLSGAERGLLTLVIIIILVLELINSIMERVADLLKPRLHQFVEEVKDIMAAAVLVSALGSIAIGVVIFGPHLLRIFSK